VPITKIDVGGEKVVVATYNPSNLLSRLYCLFVLDKINEALRDVSREEAHAWIREHFPEGQHQDLDPMLKFVESGGVMPTELRPGEFPFTPGHAQYESEIVAHLRGLHA
jgi:hypothetical protein